MKLKYLFAAVLLIAGFAACSEKPEEENNAQNEGLEAEFNIAEEAFSVQVGESKEFKITVTSGQNVKYAWYVDDEKVSSTASVTWKFDKVGTTVVKGEVSDDKTKLDQSYTVTVTGIPLDVTFTPAGNAVEAVIGTPFTASVAINAGDKQTTHEWKLDGEVAGDGLSFTKTFELADLGEHTLIYNGANADGSTATHTWTINVVDLPLEVAFTPADDAVSAMVGDKVKFSASASHGTTGIAYEWKVNGEVVADATAAEFEYTAQAEGEITIALSVTNAADETATKSWTLTVTPKVLATLLFDDFENKEIGPDAYYRGNNVGGVSILQVVENPYKTETNKSDKVLVDKGSMMSNNSSGYFTFKVNTMPDATTEISGTERYKYSKISVKIYLGETGFTPLLRCDITGSPKSAPSLINGVEFDPVNPTMEAWKAAIKTDDWNVLVYDLSNSNYSTVQDGRLSGTEQLQFRVFVTDFKDQGIGKADVYFDDITFLE